MRTHDSQVVTINNDLTNLDKIEFSTQLNEKWYF